MVTSPTGFLPGVLLDSATLLYAPSTGLQVTDGPFEATGTAGRTRWAASASTGSVTGGTWTVSRDYWGTSRIDFRATHSMPM